MLPTKGGPSLHPRLAHRADILHGVEEDDVLRHGQREPRRVLDVSGAVSKAQRSRQRESRL